MSDGMVIKNASELVTCSGFSARRGAEMSELGIIKDASVIISDGVIRTVGPTEAILSPSEEKRLRDEGTVFVEAEGKAVLPGFVDAHTHLVFGGYREKEYAWRLQGTDYMEIMRRGGGIASTVADTRGASFEQLYESGMRRLDSMLQFGVTTVEAKSGYGLDHDTEIRQLAVSRELDRKHPVDVVSTFLGPHAVPPEYAGDADGFLAFLTDRVLPEVAEQGLAEFCDVFCEKDVFDLAQSRRWLEKASAMGLKPKLHADEIVPMGGTELAASVGAVSADHLLQASDAGITAIAEKGVVAVLLPITAFGLRKPYARAREMIDRGCAVALATDFNPGSCFSESIPLVMALACLSMQMTPEEAVCAMTLNGAAALDRAHRVGSIDPGKQADLILLEFPSYRFIPYHIGVNTVEKVVKRGAVVYDRSCSAISGG